VESPWLSKALIPSLPVRPCLSHASGFVYTSILHTYLEVCRTSCVVIRSAGSGPKSIRPTQLEHATCVTLLEHSSSATMCKPTTRVLWRPKMNLRKQRFVM
jgi:hypothetical protein